MGLLLKKIPLNLQREMIRTEIIIKELFLTKEETEALFFSLLKSVNELEADHKQKKEGYTGKGLEKEIRELKELKRETKRTFD